MILKKKSQILSKTKELKRNNSNSISCNDCCFIDTSRNNNKLSVWRKWGHKKSTRQ